MDAAIETVLFELNGVLTLKEEQKTTPKAFLSGQDVEEFS